MYYRCKKAVVKIKIFSPDTHTHAHTHTRTPTSEEAEQVALLHELGDDVIGGGGGAHGHQGDEVRVTQGFENLHLPLKLLMVQLRV